MSLPDNFSYYLCYGCGELFLTNSHSIAKHCIICGSSKIQAVNEDLENQRKRRWTLMGGFKSRYYNCFGCSEQFCTSNLPKSNGPHAKFCLNCSSSEIFEKN